MMAAARGASQKDSEVYLRIEAADSGRYQEAVRHVGRRSIRTMRLSGATLMCFGVVFLLDSALLAPSVIPSLRLAFIALGLVCFVLGSLLAFAPIRYSSDRLGTLIAQPCQFELTDDHVRQTSPLHTMQIVWDAVIRFEEIPGQMLFFFAKRQFFSVPTAGLTDGQLTELRRFIADRNARPAAPKA